MSLIRKQVVEGVQGHYMSWPSCSQLVDGGWWITWLMEIQPIVLPAEYRLSVRARGISALFFPAKKQYGGEENAT